MLGEDALLAAVAQRARRAAEYRTLVPAYYARVTDSYRATWGDAFHFDVGATERWFVEAGGITPGSSVLDIGCGVGGPALTVAAASDARVTGLDLSPHHVEIARERARATGVAATFVCGDGMALPFEDASFDVAYVSESGCYMPDWGAFAGEVARVLRPHGRFVGVDWGRRGRGHGDVLIEEICRWHAIPDLHTTEEIAAGLRTAGLVVEHTGIFAGRERLRRNHADLRVVAPQRLDAQAAHTAWHMLAMGGRAIGEAVDLGAFVLVCWSARRPC